MAHPVRHYGVKTILKLNLNFHNFTIYQVIIAKVLNRNKPLVGCSISQNYVFSSRKFFILVVSSNKCAKSISSTILVSVEKLKIVILPIFWGNYAGETLSQIKLPLQNFAMYKSTLLCWSFRMMYHTVLIFSEF